MVHPDSSRLARPRAVRSKRVLWPALIVLLCTCGCIDRARANPDCRWTGDSAFPLELSNSTDRRHLIADAQLAEELAVRYADTQHKRRYGYEGHGGLIEYGRVRRDCMTKIVEVIEHTHSVTAAQIDHARAQRNLAFDLPVMLSFVAMYAAGAAIVGRWLRRRFVDASRATGAILIGAASIPFSALGVQVGVVWTAIWEAIRIGNDHLGTSRLARPLWDGHLGSVFLGGIVLFGIASVLAARSSCDPESPIGAVDGRTLSDYEAVSRLR